MARAAGCKGILSTCLIHPCRWWTKRRLPRASLVLLYDIAQLRTEGTPRLAYAGAHLLDEPVEQENQTALSVSVPTGATASIRVLQNGRRLADVSCMQGDRRLMIDYTVDQASDSGAPGSA